MKVTSESTINRATIEYSNDDTIAIPYVAMLLKKEGWSDRLVVCGNKDSAREAYLKKSNGVAPKNWDSVTYSNSSLYSLLNIKISDILKIINGGVIEEE